MTPSDRCLPERNVNVEDFEFPVIAFSPAGWIKEADEIHEFTDASPEDDLSDWQGLVIYDSSGLKYTARRVYRRWPASRLGVWICRLPCTSIHVDMELEPPCPASLDELKDRVIAYYGEEPVLREAGSHKELITLCL
jgi:hypothetical protein